jgi:hypothetical protein
LLLGLSRYRPNLVGLGLAVAWLAGALTSLRHVPVFVLIVVPMLALAAGRLPWLRRVGRQWKPSDDLREVLRLPAERAGWLGPVVVAAALLAVARWGPPLAVHNPNNPPVEALDLVLRLHREGADGGGVTFHSPDWGGYLTWHGWPGFHTWIDDRLEPQGVKHFTEYFDLRDGKQGWRDTLRAKNITLVCLTPDDALIGHLAHEPDWEKVYGDKHAIVYRKRSAGGASP